MTRIFSENRFTPFGMRSNIPAAQSGGSDSFRRFRAPFSLQAELDGLKRSFDSCRAMTREAQSLHKNHNLSHDTAIASVVAALYVHHDQQISGILLATLSSQMRDYWRI
ncbi:hypothetical protein [Brucella sp. 2716]|uniref:hypothetical protein n=1 Tax=Brucella sp. 2716 TaxID=2975052 RepID=UPI0028776965|nr:hypothetical protein [Brucella sp. 2716]